MPVPNSEVIFGLKHGNSHDCSSIIASIHCISRQVWKLWPVLKCVLGAGAD
ncbi:unnamed protein product [Staurois parvus]|uniref:Uncharacterized protein n=1 Tax=Staurois parvus TaxID=386267 RepID=A0ABN9HS70_9NEOB|nr:unnamed protein product [Staurois parvus]